MVSLVAHEQHYQLDLQHVLTYNRRANLFDNFCNWFQQGVRLLRWLVFSAGVSGLNNFWLVWNHLSGLLVSQPGLRLFEA